MPATVGSAAPDRLVSVAEVEAKLNFLAHDRKAAERGEFKQSFAAFARKIATKRLERGFDKTLKMNLRSTILDAAKNDKIDADTERIVAELTGIDPRKACWRTGSVANFKQDFLGERFDIERLGSWSIHRTMSVDLLFSENRQASP